MRIILICIVVSLSLYIILPANALAAGKIQFSDVKKSDWAYEDIMKLQELGLMSGMGGTTFGMGKTITRAEFVTVLCNLMEWEETSSNLSSFSDVNTKSWYFKKVETAFENGAIPEAAGFRPDDPVTREEIAVMSVKALGYEKLAKQLISTAPFADVSNNASYITIAKDFGIVSGIGDNKFGPAQTAAREQAAAIFSRMYDLTCNKVDFLNGFYAISSSSQMDAIYSLDAVSFGWSKLKAEENTVSLNTSGEGADEYRIPAGFAAPYNAADDKSRLLMIAVDDRDSAKIINTANLRTQSVNVIADAVNSGVDKDGVTLLFDGVVIDFETLRVDSKINYNVFLTDLRNALSDKLLYVAVHPVLPGNQTYYDGYDFKTIGKIADKVILMAHDFNPKILTDEQMAGGIVMTPGASQRDVYWALSAITNKDSGISDKSKIILQINFSVIQWKLRDGKVINKTPYTPDYNAIVSRLESGAEIKYSEDYESPYLTFKNTEDNTDNVVWYEDTRSVKAKINLAEMFGISGISLWRLGNIPDYSAETYLDVLKAIKEL